MRNVVSLFCWCSLVLLRDWNEEHNPVLKDWRRDIFEYIVGDKSLELFDNQISISVVKTSDLLSWERACFPESVYFTSNSSIRLNHNTSDRIVFNPGSSYFFPSKSFTTYCYTYSQWKEFVSNLEL